MSKKIISVGRIEIIDTHTHTKGIIKRHNSIQKKKRKRKHKTCVRQQGRW